MLPYGWWLVCLLVYMASMFDCEMTSMQGMSSIRDPGTFMYRDTRAPFNGMRGKREYLDDEYADIYNRVGTW